MNLEDMRLKISPMHRDLYRRMLGINELPEPLLRRYFGIKKLLDKVDGFITTGDLVRIALDCGFNTDTMLFEDTNQDPAPETHVVAEVSDNPTPEPEPEEIEKPEPEPAEIPVPEEVEEVPEPVEEPEPDKSFDLDDTLEPEDEEPAEKKEVLAVGTAVEAFCDGNIVRGRVNGSKEENGKVIYSIDTDEELIDVPEEDVQEV